jgi:cobalt-zinc-cadmium efflux system membrane fusion protein
MIARTQKLIGIGVLILVLYSCRTENSNSEKPENTEFCLNDYYKEKTAFEQPVLQAVTEGIPLTGAVETNPDKVVHFMSLVNGVISNTWFSVGDRVSKGQVLAELKSTELSNLQAELKYVDVRLRVAEKKLQSVKSMFEDGLATQKDFNDAESDLEILQAEKQKIVANLQFFSASSEKGVFQIKAPATGIVTAKSIVPGTQISAEGESLFTISDLNEVWIMVNVYATNVKNIKTGMSVNITTLSYPDEVFKGKIGAISQVYDEEARVLKARVVLPNPDLKLKPGMVVDVTALKPGDSEALSVPTKSVVFDENQNYVIIYKSDCDMEIRKVDILTKNNGTTYISEGLQPQEKIVSVNPLLVYEHLKNFQN